MLKKSLGLISPAGKGSLTFTQQWCLFPQITSVHSLLLVWNHAAALYNIFYVYAKSGLGWSNLWAGTTVPGVAWGFEEPWGR